MSPAPLDPRDATIQYKILTLAQHDALFLPPMGPPTEGEPYWKGIEIDLQDGFIHSATSIQIQTVLSRFFPSENSVYLLLVPTSPLSSPNPFTPTKRVTDSFRFDLADDGQPYGHFYEGLDLVRDVSGKVVVHKGEGGRWELGELAF